MTQLLITIVIAIGIASVAGFSALSLWQSARDGYDQQLLFARMEQSAAALRDNMMVIDGIPALPAGDDVTLAATTYSAVPNWVTANAVDTRGRRFHYCPYSLRATASTVGATSTSVTGPAYAIRTYSSAITRSKSYVIGSAAPTLAGTVAMAPQGLLGYIMAFKPNDATDMTSLVAWCNSVTVSGTGQLSTTGTTTAPIIYPIVVPQSVYQQTIAKNETVTLYVGTSAAGDGTGRNPANQTTLESAFAQLSAVQPYRAKLYLTAGTHTLSTINKTDGSGNDVYNRGNLRQIIYDIEGAGSGSTTISLSTTYDLPIHTILRDVTVSPGSNQIIVPPNTRLTIEDSIISNLFIRNGEVWARGTSAINNGVVVTEDGRLVINGTVTSSVPNQSDSASPPTGVLIRPGHLQVLSGASYTVTATGTTGSPKAPVVVFGGGSLSISGSMTVTSDGSTTLQSGINIVPGGTVYMNNATLTFNTGTGSIAGDTASRPGAIVVGGEMYMVNSGLLFPSGTASGVAAVVMVDGGRFALHGNSYIGNSGSTSQRPQIGVFDNGGAYVGGSSAGCGAANEPADGNTSCNTGDGGSPRSNVYVAIGGTCWTGNDNPTSTYVYAANVGRHLFTDSNSGDGQSSAPNDSNASVDYRHLRLANNTDWLCNSPAVDTTPDAFSFTDVTGWCTTPDPQTSDTITPSGFNTATTASVSGSGTPQISVNGGGWTTSTTISPGQTIQVRLSPDPTNSAVRNATVTIGGVSDVFSVTTSGSCYGGGGTNVDPFDFENVTRALGIYCSATTAYLNSDNIALPGGFTNPDTATVSIVNNTCNVSSCTVDSYVVGGSPEPGPYEYSEGDIGTDFYFTLGFDNGVSTIPSGVLGTYTVTIGDETDTFTLTGDRNDCSGSDITPNAFSFTSLTNQAQSCIVSSNTLTPAGYDTTASVSITSGGGVTSPEFRINGGSWVTSSTMSPGDTLQLRAITPVGANTTGSVTVTVGTINGGWSIATGNLVFCMAPPD